MNLKMSKFAAQEQNNFNFQSALLKSLDMRKLFDQGTFKKAKF